MPTDIGRESVRELCAEGARLVGVLPRGEYEDGHLPGAVNLPLEELDAPAAARTLDGVATVIVYCEDHQ